MDIRKFLSKPGGGSAMPPPKPKDDGKMVVTPNTPKSPAGKKAPAASDKSDKEGSVKKAPKKEDQPEAKKPRQSAGSSQPAAPKKESGDGGKTESKRPRKKAIVESDAEDESDEDVEMEDLEDSSSDDECQIVDSDDNEEGSVSKKKKSTRGKAQPVSQQKGAGSAKKRERETEVVDIDDDDEEEEKPPQKKPRAAPKPRAPSQPKTPSSASKRKTQSQGQELTSDAKAAIAAVDKALEQLPKDESQIKFSFMAEDAPPNSDAEPPNYNNKEVPEGHPEALYGKTFVITGILDSLYRETAADLIKKHSGRVTSSVSSKTTCLVVGHSIGRSKYSDAKRHGTRLIDEDGLLSLIRSTSHLKPKVEEEPLPAPAAGPSQVPSGPRTALGSTAGAPAGPSAAGSSSVSGAPVENRLWVDKYKPRSSQDLVGNTGKIKTLRDWLTAWEDVQLRGATPGQAGTGNKPLDLGKKAVLLAGPPGTGKTSTALIVARECGYDVVEMNASDTRNKADTKITAGIGGKLANVIKEMCTNRSLSHRTKDGGFSDRPTKQLLVMDEVDGMSGGDRGGIQDLIETIKRSKVPIICIANDKYNQKLKSLKNYCIELDWYKPGVDQMAKRCATICRAEGLNTNDSTLRELCNSTNGDMRLVLGQLQMLRLRHRALSYDQVKGRQGTSKDADMSPFECAKRLLDPVLSSVGTPGALNTSSRLDLYFADSDLVPLLVQENYLNHRPKIAPNEDSRLRAIAKAADCLSAGDVMNTNLRRTNNWTLAPAVGVIGTLMPTQYMAGNREIFGLYPGESNFPRFTAWMGNYSHGNKQQRLLGELTTTMASSGHVNLHRPSVRLEYSSALRTLLTAPMRKAEEEGIPDTVHLMQEYCINREQMDYVLDVTKFKTKQMWGDDPYKDIPTKVKSAFTRHFNKEGLVPKCNTMVEADGIKKGKGAKGKAAVKKARSKPVVEELEDEEGEEGEGRVKEEEEEEEKEEEEEELDSEELEARLKQEGVEFKHQTGGKGGGGRGSRGGRGGGARGGGGGGGGGRGRGGGRGSRGGKK